MQDISHGLPNVGRHQRSRRSSAGAKARWNGRADARRLKDLDAEHPTPKRVVAEQLLVIDGIHSQRTDESSGFFGTIHAWASR